ncbi:MAG: hypothetical protein RL757_274 [Bacteroidota bacterium]|jgi:multiple antibiotic resistance protein
MLAILIEVLAKMFSIVNPMGALPMYLTLTAHYSEAERLRTVRNTSIYFVLVLLAFFWGGSYILAFFGLDINALRIAGGLVILNSGFSLMNDNFNQSRAMNPEVQKEALEKPDISFSPLAMPLLSGPGSISLMIGFFAQYQSWEDRLLITAMIFLMGGVVYSIFRMAPLVYRYLGVGGLKAGSRVMSFITMAIGVQFIILGILALVKEYAK